MTVQDQPERQVEFDDEACTGAEVDSATEEPRPASAVTVHDSQCSFVYEDGRRCTARKARKHGLDVCIGHARHLGLIPAGRRPDTPSDIPIDTYPDTPEGSASIREAGKPQHGTAEEFALVERLVAQREDGGPAEDDFNDAVQVLLEKRYPGVVDALWNALDALPPHEALLIVAYAADLFAGIEILLLEERGWPGMT